MLENNNYDLIIYNAIADHLCRSYGPQLIPNVQGHILFCPYADWDFTDRFRIYSVRDIIWPFQNNSLVLDTLQRDMLAYRNQKYQEKYVGGSVFDSGGKLDRCLRCYSSVCNAMYGLCRENNRDFAMCSLEGLYELGPGCLACMDNNRYIRCEVINAEMPDGLSHQPEYRVKNNISYHPNGKVHAYWAEAFSRWFDEKYPQFKSVDN